MVADSEEEDPMGLKQLALSYDYLIYKINDHVKSLSDITFESVSQKESLIKRDYLQQQLKLDMEMAQIDKLLVECDKLELEFMKLDQLKGFVDDFKVRVSRLETQFSRQ
ncbi:hypothetical protein PSN45_002684 [Yamadazyma tenuis]|uniref:Biogenesis of lysosome-related organelles complex 1 subunit CNL1 n=1 Tax=Candida tenuis (strain ATCC 10573 / BCRC 21748 / CBS 615 / JCM 9827 / NBRC 10315 / NRRL Y-1498 / VKM Y-70) TaxID=590646 RepID=G3AX61_CANTC|nr:uncharacterized protein CANTEDRAFT_100841 [Yamadazyma tenuis ATCC 10573]EGV66696.1 hypothetical protein CANTEDRAFT_100841 [Yamadazyma tenuis ATCC 10573]WEJ95171.1 hypothetical protein PSN45_002684 [Yamadazyma tenuis]